MFVVTTMNIAPQGGWRAVIARGRACFPCWGYTA